MDPGIWDDQVPTVTWEELLEELRRMFASDRVNVDEVQALLESYRTTRKDWQKYAIFDTHRYTRNLVDTGNGKYNLLILCWGEGHGSSIHDHSDAHCFVKVLAGQLTETMYEWPQGSETDQPMRETATDTYEPNEVTYMNDEKGLHRMENRSHTERTVTLHLYSPPFEFCNAFDEYTGHKNKVKVTFWSKYGKKTPFDAVSMPCTSTKNALPESQHENN